MAIYYSITFAILVTEMVFFGLLVLPLPSRWRHAILHTISTSPAVDKAMYALKIIFGFIFVLFIDTVNRLNRLESTEEEKPQVGHDYGYQANLKVNKFYTQRNLYLTGFTLFLSLILERTSALILELLQREKELKVVKDENSEVLKNQDKLISLEDKYKKQVETLNNELKELQKEALDFETLKKQAEQQTEEYNRLYKLSNTDKKDI